MLEKYLVPVIITVAAMVIYNYVVAPQLAKSEDFEIQN